MSIPGQMALCCQRIVVARGVLGIVLFGWILAGIGWGLEITDQRWGFDGRVVPERFAVLSVLVSNAGSTPFDGQLRLERVQGFDVVDAPMVESVYLAPGSSRWVQFHPWIDELGYSNWRIVWGEGVKERLVLNNPNSTRGRPALVVLESAGRVGGATAATNRFPEDLFPRHATACAGLGGVLLDHEPRWSEVQQRAFLDWIRLGGELHLTLDSAGRLPKLTGLLSALSGGDGTVPWGAGFVRQHDVPMSAFDSQTIRSRVLNTNRWLRDRAARVEGEGGVTEPIPETGVPFSDQELEVDGPLLRLLKGLTRAEHSWVLIHSLSILFLTLVFPGGWYLGQQRKGDYRMVFGVLIAMISLFSLIFFWVGRRGAGEASIVDTLFFAEQIEPGRFRLSGWSNVFVTQGGNYEFQQEGTGRMYSSGQSSEGLRGMIRNGAEASLVTDMPPFSSRSILSHMIAEGPKIEASVRKVEISSSSGLRYEFKSDRVMKRTEQMVPALARLELELRGKFRSTPPGRILVVFGGRVYEMSAGNKAAADGGMVLTVQSGGTPLPQFLKVSEDAFGNMNAFMSTGVENTPATAYRTGLDKAVQKGLGLRSSRDVFEFELPTDRVRLLIYDDPPPEFRFEGDQLPKQRGRCLYSLDVPLESRP
ncbi:MAG: hypothetical protein ACK50P_15970 [Planctomycetaceae bacterium]|jgi:hypothetical protein